LDFFVVIEQLITGITMSRLLEHCLVGFMLIHAIQVTLAGYRADITHNIGLIHLCKSSMQFVL